MPDKVPTSYAPILITLSIMVAFVWGLGMVGRAMKKNPGGPAHRFVCTLMFAIFAIFVFSWLEILSDWEASSPLMP